MTKGAAGRNCCLAISICILAASFLRLPAALSTAVLLLALRDCAVECVHVLAVPQLACVAMLLCMSGCGRHCVCSWHGEWPAAQAIVVYNHAVKIITS